MRQKQHHSKTTRSEQARVRKGFIGLGVVLSVFVVAIGVLAACFVLNSQTALYSFAAQPDEKAQEQAIHKEPAVKNASTQVINLVSLMGLSQNDAIKSIGHGADVQTQKSLSSLGFLNEVVLALTDEKGDALSGTPSVTLGLDDAGAVRAASYEASTSLLGYGDIAFVPVVRDFHIVETMLNKVGLKHVKPGTVTLPDPSAYSSYESDQKTLSHEKYTFSGHTDEDNQGYDWQVTLDYDYTQANKTADLANTIKKITVSIRQAA